LRRYLEDVDVNSFVRPRFRHVTSPWVGWTLLSI
jgi:hypothetical protein